MTSLLLQFAIGGCILVVAASIIMLAANHLDNIKATKDKVYRYPREEKVISRW